MCVYLFAPSRGQPLCFSLLLFFILIVVRRMLGKYFSGLSVNVYLIFQGYKTSHNPVIARAAPFTVSLQ